jgi:hypothetical protein
MICSPICPIIIGTNSLLFICPIPVPSNVAISIFCSKLCQNFDVSISRNFDIEIGISISVSILIVFFRRTRNSDEIPYWFRLHFDVEIRNSISGSMSKSKFRFRFRFRNQNWFWYKISLQMSKFQSIFTKISQKFYFGCLPEFRFRSSKSKFQVLAIIWTNNFFEIRN